jgi:nucleoside-diphosphate-sugar epimerase
LHSLNALLKTTKAAPDALIHLAAAVPATKNLPDTIELSDETRRIDRVVLAAALKWETHIVYASGCSLYNNYVSEYHEEDEPIAGPINSNYLRAKREGEEAALAQGSASVLRIAGFRGEGTPNWTVAGRFVAAIREQRVLTVNGDGLDEVDLVDLSDIAEAIVLSSIHRYSGILNVASGSPINIKDLARLFCQVAETDIQLVLTGHQGARRYARFSITRARSYLGWRPSVSFQNSIQGMLIK